MLTIRFALAIGLSMGVARGVVAQTRAPRLPDTPRLAPAPKLSPSPELSPSPGEARRPSAPVVHARRRPPHRRHVERTVFYVSPYYRSGYDASVSTGALPPTVVATTPNGVEVPAEPETSAQPNNYQIPTYQVPTYSIPKY